MVLPDGRVLPRVDRATPIPAAWPQLSWTEPGVKTAAGYYPADNLLLGYSAGAGLWYDKSSESNDGETTPKPVERKVKRSFSFGRKPRH